jgi:hypothetical protein
MQWVEGFLADYNSYAPEYEPDGFVYKPPETTPFRPVKSEKSEKKPDSEASGSTKPVAKESGNTTSVSTVVPKESGDNKPASEESGDDKPASKESGDNKPDSSKKPVRKRWRPNYNSYKYVKLVYFSLFSNFFTGTSEKSR